MKCRRLRARRDRDPAELNITAFMNLMVVLVPFLLITAVFSRMAVLELNLPGEGAEAAEDTPALALELVVRGDAIAVADRNSGPLTRIAADADGHDLRALSAYLAQVKRRHPDVRDATLLVAPDVLYDTLVQVMDTVREVPDGDGGPAELFPLIAIGDAPLAAEG